MQKPFGIRFLDTKKLFLSENFEIIIQSDIAQSNNSKSSDNPTREFKNIFGGGASSLLVGTGSANSNSTSIFNISTYAVWEIQRKQNFQGGRLLVTDLMRFKNVSTGLYLCVDKMHFGKLTLTYTPNEECEFLIIKEKNLNNPNLIYESDCIKIYSPSSRSFINLGFPISMKYGMDSNNKQKKMTLNLS